MALEFIELRYSRQYCVFLFCVMLALVGVSCWMMTVDTSHMVGRGRNGNAMGLLGVVLFGLGALKFLWQYFDKRPQLIINDEGIYCRSWGIGLLLWQDVRDITLGGGNKSMLCVQVNDLDFYVKKSPLLKRLSSRFLMWMGHNPLQVNAGAFEMKDTEILDTARELKHRSMER